MPAVEQIYWSGEVGELSASAIFRVHGQDCVISQYQFESPKDSFYPLDLMRCHPAIFFYLPHIVSAVAAIDLGLEFGSAEFDHLGLVRLYRYSPHLPQGVRLAETWCRKPKPWKSHGTNLN